MEYNNDFRYDLQVGNQAETELASIFASTKVEVKWDLKADETGNIFIEHTSRGKASGIRSTEADYWAIKLSKTSPNFIVVPVSYLKERLLWLVTFNGWNMHKKGGDNNSSEGFLGKYRELI